MTNGPLPTAVGILLGAGLTALFFYIWDRWNK